MSYIRKISVGLDYKNAMHYIVGQTVMGGYAVIEEIVRLSNEDYVIYIKNSDNEIFEWKTLVRMSVIHENDINLL